MKTISRTTKLISARRKASRTRRRLMVEQLETRQLLTVTISISDAAAVEGDLAVRYIDDFAAVGNSGMANPRYVLFGPDDNLYVASGNTDEVLRFDGKTGEFLDVFVTSGSGGLDGPWSMLFGPDGNGDGKPDLYVTGTLSNNVLRYDGTNGNLIDEFVTSGSGGLNQPKGITFGPDGHLYVSSTAGAGGIPGPHRVLRFRGFAGSIGELAGDPLPAPGRTGADFVPDGISDLNNPNGLAFGPDGNLYVANTWNDSVNRFESGTGNFIDVFVPRNSGGLDTTSVLAFRDDGYLYVTSQSSNQVLRYNATNGAFVDAVVPTGAVGLSAPCGIAFDAAGNFYVSSWVNSTSTARILRFGPTLQAAFSVNLSAPSTVPVTVNYSTVDGSAAGGSDFEAVTGTLTFAPGQTSRTILVRTLDYADPETTETFTVSLTNPVGATIFDGVGIGTILDNDPFTKFYVVNDASTNHTYEYGSTGTTVENYALNSVNSAPRGAASTVAGDKVWVVDANKNVYIYNTSGGLLGSWSAGSLASNSTVEGITTNGTDVWIVDSRSDKVYKYAGAATRTSGSQNAASSFSLNSSNRSPTDLVTDGSSFWVLNNTSSTDKVFKYTVGGSLLGSWTISSGGGSPTGITIDPSNVSNIWIVDNNTDRVYQFDAAASRTSSSQSPSFSFALATGNTNPQGIADPPPTASLNTTPETAVSNSSSSSSFMQAPIVLLGASSIERASLRSSLAVTEGADQFMSRLASALPAEPTRVSKAQSIPALSRPRFAEDQNIDLALADDELSESLDSIANDLLESTIR